MRTKFPVTDHPAGAHKVVLGDGLDGGVAAGLGLAVNAQGAGGLVLGMRFDGAVEGVLAGNVHESQIVADRLAGEIGGPRGVGPPGQATPFGRFGAVDIGPRGGVDDDVVSRPVDGGHGGRLRDVDVGQIDAGSGESRPRQAGQELPAQLAVRTGDQHASSLPPAPEPGGRGNGRHIPQAGVGPVLVGHDRVIQRNRPRDGRSLIGEVEEGVVAVGRPMIVDEVGVGRSRFERLIGVAHARRHVDGH